MSVWRFMRAAFVAILLLVVPCLSSSCARYKTSLLVEHLILFNLSNGPIWRYSVSIHLDCPIHFEPGDTIRIAGEGIESASVEGEAREEEFGAWRVKEFDWKYVIFEATCEATVSGGAFGCLSVTAPKAKKGKVQWWWLVQSIGGWTDEALGPASVAK